MKTVAKPETKSSALKPQALKGQMPKHPFLVDPARELLAILIERKAKNRSYSARAFARDAGVSAAYLSQVLSGKRNLSLKQAMMVADRLGVKLDTKSESLGSLVAATEGSRPSRHFQLVQNGIEHEKIIRHWYHFAILELCQTKGAQASPEWISDRLGISELEAKVAVERLLEFGYIQVSETGKMKRTKTPFVFDVKRSSLSVREQHQSRLQAATEELEDGLPGAVAHRNFQTLFVATSRGKIESAKVMINEFTQKLMKHLAEGPQEEVFQYSTQFFSAENKKKKNV